MTYHHVNQGRRSLEVMTPNFEGFENGKQFFVMDIVVEFGWGTSPRVKSDQIDLVVSGRYGGKDGHKGIVLLCDDLSEADNGVAKSNGGDVGGTWLQLMCCALPKHLCP